MAPAASDECSTPATAWRYVKRSAARSSTSSDARWIFPIRIHIPKLGTVAELLVIVELIHAVTFHAERLTHNLATDAFAFKDFSKQANAVRHP